MIDHTSIEFHNDRLKEIQSILDKLAPHEHGDGMNECHICDQELDEAILIELRKILERKEAVADDVEAARQVALNFIREIGADCERVSRISGIERAEKRTWLSMAKRCKHFLSEHGVSSPRAGGVSLKNELARYHDEIMAEPDSKFNRGKLIAVLHVQGFLRNQAVNSPATSVSSPETYECPSCKGELTHYELHHQTRCWHCDELLPSPVSSVERDKKDSGEGKL